MAEQVKILVGVGRGRAGQAAILEVSSEVAEDEIDRLGSSGIGWPAAPGLHVWEGRLDVPEPGRTLWDGSWRRPTPEEVDRLSHGLPAWEAP